MFNPAIHTKSIRLKTTDLKRIYQHTQNPTYLFARNGSRAVIFPDSRPKEMGQLLFVTGY
jgi:hypothetical protein